MRNFVDKYGVAVGLGVLILWLMTLCTWAIWAHHAHERAQIQLCREQPKACAPSVRIEGLDSRR